MSGGGGRGAGWIFLGLVAGAAAGIACNRIWGPQDARVVWVAANVAAPAGKIFLNLLFMIVVPIVFSSLALGVAGLGGRSLGRVGTRTLAWFLLTTALAAAIGITLVNVFEPGMAVDAGVRDALLEASRKEAGEKIAKAAEGSGFSIDMLVAIVPKNPLAAAAGGDMLGLIFFALLFGLALGRIPEAQRAPMVAVLDALYAASAKIIGWAMATAPIGVAALVFDKAALFGTEILRSLAAYLATALGGLAIQLFVVLGGLCWLLARVPPGQLLRRSRALIATAFSTSSSSATLPTTIATAQQEFGVPREIAGFVLPLGATLNMNGTALFEGVVVLFLAQVSNVELTLAQQITVVVMAVLTSIGAAGVPGGSLPLVVLVLAQVGVQPEMLALVLGVDRLVDMARTVPNVMGDLVGALVVARAEGVLEVPPDGPRSAS